MKTLLLSFLALCTLAVIAHAVTSSTPHVIQLDHEIVAAAFSKGGPLLVTNNFKIQAGRRVEAGEAEVHATDTDIFYIMEGTAVFVTGGTVVQPRTIGPGETRAKGISGGEERRLTKGDIIVIPTGVPHWFKEVHSLFLYYVVKVSK